MLQANPGSHLEAWLATCGEKEEEQEEKEKEKEEATKMEIWKGIYIYNWITLMHSKN